ncbi:MAG: ECF RNA polymerase sigma factor SigK [Mycetocola sp.]
MYVPSEWVREFGYGSRDEPVMLDYVTEAPQTPDDISRPADPDPEDLSDRDRADADLGALLEQIAGGDQSAFAQLYDRVSARVMGLAVRVLVDRAQAEEVTQEVLLEVWRSAALFDRQRGSAAGWILTMTHRRAVDRVRASQASQRRDERIGVRDIEPDYDSVAEAAEVRVEHSRVAQALERLSEPQREAIVLSYYGGWSQSDVAAQLQVPLGTIKTRIRDGMIRLRQELGVTR